MANIQSIITNGNGNVLIGTTTDAGYRLYVSGNQGTVGTSFYLGTLNGTAIAIDHSGVNTWRIGVNNTNTSTFSIGNDIGGTFASKYLNITNSGNVGIGTTSTVANSLLNIAGGVNITTGIIGYNTSDAFTLNGKTQPHYGLNLDPTGSSPIGISGYFGIAMATNGAERLRIVGSTGNVLINTTTDSGYKLSVNGNAYVGGTFYQAGGNYRLGIQIPYPGDNYGNGVIYLRVASSASSRIGSLKIRVSATWNWTPAWGYVEATVGFFWTGSAFYDNSGTNIISATGYAAYTLNIGQPVEENGYISIPIYSSNSNPIYALVEATPDISPDSITLSGWSTTTHPGTADVFIQTELGVGTRSPSARLHVSGGDGIINNAFIGEVPTYTSANAQFSHTSRAGAGEYSFLSANDGETFINSKTGYNIRFRVNNADQVIINSSGNVGIGTTAPYGRLELNGSGQSWTTAPAIRMWDSFNTKGWLVGNVNNITPGDFYIRTLPSVNGNPGTNQQEFTIKHATGAVGIGTTSPDRGLTISKGDQYASLNIYKTNTTNQIVYLGTGSSGADDDAILQLFDEATEKVRIFTAGNSWFNGGNVGIGTTAPSLESSGVGLDILNSSYTQLRVRSSSSSAGIEFKPGSSGDRWEIQASTDSKWFVYNRTDEQYRLLIDGSGNVGIGTTAPGSKLTIGDSFATIAGLTIDTGNGGDSAIVARKTASKPAFGVLPWDSSVFLSAGVYYDGSAWQHHSNDNNNQLFVLDPSTGVRWYASNDGAPSWNVSSNELLWDNSSIWKNLVRSTRAGDSYFTGGNVGIGTTSPLSKLDVSITSTQALFIANESGTISDGDLLGAVSFGSRDGSTYSSGGITNIRSYATATYNTGSVSGDMRFYVSSSLQNTTQAALFGTEAMRIASSGNLLIGTTTDNGDKLQVSGNTTINGSLYLRGGSRYIVGDGGDLYIDTENVAGRDLLLQTQSGQNVGINTTSPSYKLDVVGDTRITSGSLGVGVAPNATDGRIDASNDIVAYQTSDRRLKENITPIANALDKVKSLTGVEFDWKEETKHVHGYEGHDTGIIAQEVQAVMPTAVRTNDSGYLSVRYEKLIGLLVEANKELAARVEELEAKLK